MPLTKNLLSLKNFILAAGLPGIVLLLRNVMLFITFRKRELDDYAAVDDSAIIQIIYVLIAFCISVYFLIQYPQKKRILFSKPQIYLLLFIAVCFLSIIWTENIFVTAYRAFESLTYLLLISIVVYNLLIRLSYQNMVEWAVFWVVWDMAWSLLLSIKTDGFSYLMWPFKTSQLTIPMILFMAVILSERKYLKYLFVIFAILSASNKIYFGVALGVFGFLYGDSRYKGRLVFLIMVILAAIIIIDPVELLKNTLFYGRQSVSMADTSGRDEIWSIAWQGFLNRPFLGYGFVDGESRVLYSQFRNGAINTHSFLFSGLLGTGILGTIFLLLYFWNAFKVASSKYLPEHRWRPALVSTFIMSFVVSLTAPGVGGRVYASWIPVVFIFTLISALKIKFQLYNYIKIHQKTFSDENNLGHKKLFRLPNTGLRGTITNARS
jgi:O-antigen ligase